LIHGRAVLTEPEILNLVLECMQAGPRFVAQYLQEAEFPTLKGLRVSLEERRKRAEELLRGTKGGDDF
jgi:hypothetical protein